MSVKNTHLTMLGQRDHVAFRQALDWLSNGSTMIDPDPWTIVSDLEMHYVLMGNVRRADDRVRVFAKLSAASDPSVG